MSDTSTVDGSSTPLRVTIIGAGIAGLTCALSFRHQNPTARITLLEKSAFEQHKETGAALYVAPNSSDHLLRLGWNSASSGSNKCEGFVSIDGLSGNVRKQMDLSFADEKWRGTDGRSRPWLLCHRVDLHRELKRMVLDDSGEVPGLPAVLHCGIAVKHIDVESGTVVLQDGREFEADAIIGADGNASICRTYVAPGAELKPFGKCCYRFLIDRQTLLDDPETQIFVKDKGYFADVTASDRKFVAYPCRNNTQINFACFSPEVMEGTGRDWDQVGSKANLERSFENFFPQARKVLTYAGSDLKVWQMMDLDRLETFVKGRLVLIGDAAHPILPYLGQGAAQAQEDAVCIATLLQQSVKINKIPELLQLYDSIRRERVHHIQEMTRRNGSDEGKGRLSPDELFAVLNDCYVHDEWANTQARLDEHKRLKS